MSDPTLQNKLLDLVLKQLTNTIDDIKQGKQPEMSPSMRRLADELEHINSKKHNLSEQEIKDFAEKLLKDIPNLE